jgi:hypothetical protein
MKNLRGVAPGQVWMDNEDRRRELTIERVEPPYAYVHRPGLSYSLRIRLDRFTAARRGYTLKSGERAIVPGKAGSR